MRSRRSASAEDPKRTHDDALKAIGRVSGMTGWGDPGENVPTLGLGAERGCPGSHNGPGNDDPQTSRVVAVLLCRLITFPEMPDPSTPLILRAAADSLRARLRNPGPRHSGDTC